MGDCHFSELREGIIENNATGTSVTQYCQTVPLFFSLYYIILLDNPVFSNMRILAFAQAAKGIDPLSLLNLVFNDNSQK